MAAGILAGWLLASLLVASDQMLLFNTGTADKPIRGEPKLIRIERLDLSGGPTAAVPYLHEFVLFERDRGPSERSISNPDGTLQFREVYLYISDGRLAKVTTLDGSGAVSRIETIRSLSPETEERVATDGNENEIERTVTVRDHDGKVLSSDLTELGEEAENKRIRLEVKYDLEGTPAEALTLFEKNDGSTLEYEVTFRGGQEESLRVYYAAKGAPRTLVAQPGKGGKGTIDRVDSVDQNGNWTKKTILELDQNTQESKILAEITRTITYY